MSFNLGPTINLSGSCNTQLRQLNYAGLTYTTVGSTFSVIPITYNNGDFYLSLTGIQAGTYASLVVGNYIVGSGIPSCSKIVAVITTNTGAGTGTYQMSCSQPQSLGTVSGCSAATATLQNYGQVVASAPTFTDTAFRGQLDFNVPATNKTPLIMSLTNGNVGIGGKPNPLSTLDISGTVSVLNGNLAIGKQSATQRLALDVSGTMSILNGNLAVGTTNQLAGPGYAMDVSGIINTNTAYNLSYSTLPTFTSNMIGYITTGTPVYTTGTPTLTAATALSIWNFNNCPVGIFIISFQFTYQYTTASQNNATFIDISTNSTAYQHTLHTGVSNNQVYNSIGCMPIVNPTPYNINVKITPPLAGTYLTTRQYCTLTRIA